MGDRRKLQGEIDRCLKKVTEGVELFDDIWQKVHSAPNHNQKDKYEQELKKEIKKLQRHRDQIKGWLSSPDVKDKTPLQEARKQIETQMERFKVVEREMKTKAYSNHGLDAGLKADPQEKEKEECIHWITEGISELRIQIDKFESDIESISATMKKRRNDRDKQERLDEMKHSIERHKFHIESLEKILRAMDNEAIDLKLVRDLQADVEHYVKSNQEPDFKENDMMYDEIDMDNLTTIMAPLITTAPSQSHPPSLPNGATSSLSSNPSALIDLSTPLANIHPNLHPTTERAIPSSATNSTHGDNDLTTPSSTQPSSPTASPALSSTDEQKRTKFDLDDQSSQRKRSNSSTNGSLTTTTTLSHLTSPKSSSSSVPKHSQSSTNPPPFNYSTSVGQTSTSTTNQTTVNTPPVLPYSAIVSQNTSSTTTTGTTSNSNVKQQVFSPSSKQMSRQLSTDTNATASTSHPPSLLGATNDRTNLTSQHSHNDHLQSSLSSSSGGTLNNGPTISSSIYTTNSTGSTSRTNSNIPLELPLTNSTLDPSMNSQQSPLLSRILPDNDRSINPSISSSSSTITTIATTTAAASTMSGPPPGIANGTSDSHSALDPYAFPNLPPPSSDSTSTMNTNLPTTPSFLPAEPLPSNGGLIGQMPDLHSNRFPFASTQHQHHQHQHQHQHQQQSMVNTRVPLTPAEQRMLNRLNSAFTKLPSLLESERQRTNANRIYARTPLAPGQTVPYYPQVPPTGSDTPEFYYRLAPDTLFFVFYYMEGTRAQYLAAKALKRQLWRFHTKHMMWFQRHEEPKVITDEYEQGAYIFFDYTQWQTRKRDSFTFEYKFLEDREF